jgi:non-ribosomal peptide synthetase component F
MLSGTIKEQEKYWLTRFQGEIPVLNLPTDYSRPGVRSFEGGDVGFQLGPEETNALYEMASSQEATLFMVLLAVFNILLSKICNQEDIVVGTPAAGRRHADLEGIIGMFVNMLALRNCPGKEKTFSDFLKEVKENTLAAFENQDYPFEDLVEKVARYTEREAGRSPVFDVVFALESMDAQPEKAPRETREELNLHPYRYENKATKFDLSLMAVAKGKRLEFIFQYYTKIFDLETVNRLIDYFKGTLAFILKDPGTKISGISLIDERDKDLLVKKMRDENYDFIDADTATSEGKTKLEADFDY